jgi:hypothetical protein
MWFMPRFPTIFLVSTALITCIFFAFILWMDPYGVRVKAGDSPGPVMDLNQRYMYPRLVRSQVYDSAVFGTSTVRLIDPQQLDHNLKTRFANLAMNAATPWEQMQLAQLFVRKTPHTKHIFWGIDPTWCAPDATSLEKQRTFRPFPPWLYDDSLWNNVTGQLSFTTLEVAIRVAGFYLGQRKPRLRDDGFEIFTPPEHTYDVSRARHHLWGTTSTEDEAHIRALWEKPSTPYPLTPQEQQGLAFPALDWLRDVLKQLPENTQVTFVFPPVHISAQPRPGGREAALETLCKAHIASFKSVHQNTNVLDWRIGSQITSHDENYWDPLHYRLPIAQQLTQKLIDQHRP